MNSELPRERCLEKGAESLSLRECVALILHMGPKNVGSLGLAQNLLTRAGTDLPEKELECAFFHSLEKNPSALFENILGMGDATRARLLAAFEIGRRYHRFRSEIQSHENLAQLSGLHPHACALSRVPQTLRSEQSEWIGFVPIHSNHEIGQFCLVEKGSRSFIHFEASELFARLLSLRPKGYFLFHNHPSGNLTPSRQDIELTEKLRKLSRELGTPLVDHGIVSFHNMRWIMV